MKLFYLDLESGFSYRRSLAC